MNKSVTDDDDQLFCLFLPFYLFSITYFFGHVLLFGLRACQISEKNATRRSPDNQIKYIKETGERERECFSEKFLPFLKAVVTGGLVLVVGDWTNSMAGLAPERLAPVDETTKPVAYSCDSLQQ